MSIFEVDDWEDYTNSRRLRTSIYIDLPIDMGQKFLANWTIFSPICNSLRPRFGANIRYGMAIGIPMIDLGRGGEGIDIWRLRLLIVPLYINFGTAIA